MPDHSPNYPEQTSLLQVSAAATTWRRKWLRLAGIAALAVALVTLAILVNNNFRLVSNTRSELEDDLNRTLSSAIEYLDSHKMELGHYNANCALIYMIRDMAILTDDERLHTIVRAYVTSYPHIFWKRMIFWQHPDPEETENEELSSGEIQNLTADQRWFYHVIGGSQMTLDKTESDLLFSPTACTARKLTHQLFALNLLQGAAPQDDKLLALRQTLCERIASEASIDCRAADLYYQRLAFLLMAEREDLVNPRWVELLIKFQQSDGGWGFSYRPLLIESLFGEQASDDHAAVQAAWVLCQLKFRYPEWIKRNYPE